MVEASRSVNAFSVPMAASIVLCSLSAGQFAGPLVLTPVAVAVGGEFNKSALLAGSFIVLTVALVALIREILKYSRART
jgi:hypothetical protein